MSGGIFRDFGAGENPHMECNGYETPSIWSEDLVLARKRYVYIVFLGSPTSEILVRHPGTIYFGHVASRSPQGGTCTNNYRQQLVIELERIGHRQL